MTVHYSKNIFLQETVIISTKTKTTAHAQLINRNGNKMTVVAKTKSDVYSTINTITENQLFSNTET